jgi:hypothetical protein
MKERDRSKDQVVDGRDNIEINLKWEDVDWIHLAQDSDQLGTL